MRIVEDGPRGDAKLVTTRTAVMAPASLEPEEVVRAASRALDPERPTELFQITPAAVLPVALDEGGEHRVEPLDCNLR